MKNSVIAGGLMIVPLVIAAAIAYWPSGHQAAITNVVMLPPTVHGSVDLPDLADEISGTVSKRLTDAGVGVTIQQTAGDLPEAKQGNAVVLIAMTVDAGIFQLDLRLIESGTQRAIWRNSYQSPRSSFKEMIEAAADGLRRAIQTGA